MSSAPTSKGQFKTGAISQISGVNHRTIDYWARRGVLVPSVTDAAGRGTDRIYSLRDLTIAVIMGELQRSTSLSLEAQKRIGAAVRKRGKDPYLSVFLTALVSIVINMDAVRDLVAERMAAWNGRAA